jgi:hypothetical protein
MNELWYVMGKIRWPLLMSVLVIVALTLWSATRLTGRNASADVRTKAWIDAILFWGGFALISGIFGTLMGIMSTASAIEAAGGPEPRLAWAGLRVAMTSVAAGALILALASLVWFGLQLRWRLLVARATGSSGAGLAH